MNVAKPSVTKDSYITTVREIVDNVFTFSPSTSQHVVWGNIGTD